MLAHVSAEAKIKEAVLVTDAYGVVHEAIAVSHVQEGRKFPIVWVKFSTRGEAIPWPVTDVEYCDSSREAMRRTIAGR
jgi:hypothetical protein